MHGASILVIEDDEAYRHVVITILENAGFEVLPASDFASAMPIIESKERVDLLLTDIVMPTGTPQGIAIALMARERRPNLKVVYMSGHHDVRYVGALIDGAEFLRKPFRAPQLIALIESVLGSESAEQGIRRTLSRKSPQGRARGQHR